MLKNSSKLIMLLAGITVLALMSQNAYSEVTSIQTDKSFYPRGESIVFSGMVEEQESGLVTIVIHDSNGDFVKLVQVFPDLFTNQFQYELIPKEKNLAGKIIV